MEHNKLLKQIEGYVTALFKWVLHPTLIFHNLQHTQNVVRRSKEISGHYKLSEDEKLILFSATWFHDSGHLFTNPENHETMSCRIMKQFMKEYIKDQVKLTKIEECIMATKFPRNSQNLLEQIICDADTYHLGTLEFEEMNKRMLEETKLKKGKSAIINFNEETIKILMSHRFYTGYCKELLDAGKLKNLRKLLL